MVFSGNRMLIYSITKIFLKKIFKQTFLPIKNIRYAVGRL
jgi:hypothetical protein